MIPSLTESKHKTMGKTEKKMEPKPYEIKPIVHSTTGGDPFIYDGKIIEGTGQVIEEKN